MAKSVSKRVRRHGAKGKTRKPVARAVKHRRTSVNYCYRPAYVGPSLRSIHRAMQSNYVLREKEAALARTYNRIVANRILTSGTIERSWVTTTQPATGNVVFSGVMQVSATG